MRNPELTLNVFEFLLTSKKKWVKMCWTEEVYYILPVLVLVLEGIFAPFYLLLTSKNKKLKLETRKSNF